MRKLCIVSVYIKSESGMASEMGSHVPYLGNKVADQSMKGIS